MLGLPEAFKMIFFLLGAWIAIKLRAFHSHEIFENHVNVKEYGGLWRPSSE